MKIAKQVFGMSVFIAILAGLTWISTDVYITALHINTSWAATIHAATIVFWVLFLFSFFSGEIIQGAHIKILYRTCNIIFGMMFYLFLGSVFLSILLALIPTLSPLIPIGIIVLSFILGVIGLIQARRITMTHHTVTLHNAPKTWHGRTAVFLSDTHFGLMNHKHFAEKVITAIQSINPDLVFHGGDFYDGPSINTAPITDAWKKLTQTTPVFYTSGNHELYGPYETFITSIRDAGVTVLLNESVVHDGVQIMGITYQKKGADKKVRTVLETIATDPTLPLILINHPPTFHAPAFEKGVSLMLSGHTHRGQFSPIGMLTRLIYKKYNYGKHSFKTMAAITSRGVGTAGPPMRLGNPPELIVITFSTQEEK